MTQQTDHLLALANSVEYKLFRDLDRIARAYQSLVNAESLSAAQESIKEVRAAAADMKAQIKKILEVEGVPPSEIRNVEAKTLDTLDNKWLNANHFYMRFLHCFPEHKLKNLTALFYLIADLSAVAEETKPELYYWASASRPRI